MRWTLARGRRIGALASLAAPLAVVAGVKLLGLGPLTSQARVDVENPEADAPAGQRATLVVEPILSIPAGTSLAWDRAVQLAAQSAGEFSSPFYQPPRRDEPPAAPPTVPPPPAAPEPPRFTLNGVMNGRPPFAVIDGEIRRVGDALGDGWSIVEIDARNLNVTLGHIDGRTHRLATSP